MPNTFATVSTSLGEEMLVLASMTGHEALGRPFKYELDLYSMDETIQLKDLLGESVTVQLELKENEYRYINGVVTRFACIGHSGRHVRYRATLRPWFWLLSRHMDCRIFQGMTVPDVIKKVFRLHDFSQFDELLTRPYREWEYICQYRESSFNFISRLMEQEGIYYYFKHEKDRHTLYMTDSYSGHRPQPGYDEIPYYPPEPTEQRERDHIDGWRVTQEIQPGKFALNDFDFKKPKAGLVSVLNAPENKGQFEVYDYPGEYEIVGDGEQYTRVRMEQAASEYEIVEGQGNPRGLTVGSHFTLTGHPRKDQNREYLVTAATYALEVGDYESKHRHAGPTYRCTFHALETNTPYRPPRETPKPNISGPQTAIVVGGKGDEIYTDRYGRVKVKFHWDRTEGMKENSSCWIRVAQVWAGARWGAMHIPRVGDEVVVEFLEGDPDRPLVTGRVYNASNMPPYELPGNKTQSGIKSRSSKGGTMDNFNELRFEDKKGEEQVYMQAEKNMDTLVKNNQTLTVGADRTKTITGNETTEVHKNRTETVTLNEDITINVNRTEKVGALEDITIGGNRTEKVGGGELVTITLGRIVNIGLADVLNVGGALSQNIGAAHAVVVAGGQLTAVGAARSVKVAGSQSHSVEGPDSHSVGPQSVTVKGTQSISVSGDRGSKVDGSDSTKAGKHVVVNAGDSITFKTGSASITMKSNGDIVLKGKNISLKGSGKINAKASGDVIVKGSNIGEN